jgi:aminotransferase
MVEERCYSEVTLSVVHLKPAERFKNVKTSGKRLFFELARRMPDVANLGIDEPDFTPPGHVLDAVETAAKAGKTHYTPTNGILEL